MRMELEEKLVKDFPALFKGKDKPVTESLMAFGCECDDGWYPVIRNVCHAIYEHIQDTNQEFEFTQVKEKYGGLRIYYFGGDDFTEGVIRMAEYTAYRTCEVCGNPGSLCHAGVWLKVLCPHHAEKNNYEKCTEDM